MDRPLLTIENANSNGYIFSLVTFYFMIKIISLHDKERVKFFDFKGNGQKSK